MMSENTDKTFTCAQRDLVNWIVHHKEKEKEKRERQRLSKGEEELAGFQGGTSETHSPLKSYTTSWDSKDS